MKKQGSSEVRVIFDATHGVLSNAEIRVNDLLAFPMSGDIQVMVHEMSTLRFGWGGTVARKLTPTTTAAANYRHCH